MTSDGGKAMCSSEAEKGNEQKGRGMFPSLPYGRGHKWEKRLRVREESTSEKERCHSERWRTRQMEGGKQGRKGMSGRSRRT